MNMNKLLKTACAFLMVSLLSSCGNSSVDGEAIGQSKKVTYVTPVFCPDYYAFDMSLGVIQNGSGSVSTQDFWYTVYDPIIIAKLKNAVKIGAIVKIKYTARRFAVCTEDYILTGIDE